MHVSTEVQNSSWGTIDQGIECLKSINTFPVADSFDSFYKLATAIARNWQLFGNLYQPSTASTFINNTTKINKKLVCFFLSAYKKLVVVSSTARDTLVQESPIQWLVQGPRIILQNHQTYRITWYLSFFLHWQNFWGIKFTPKNANFSRSICKKTPLFRVKSLENANFSR